MKVKLPGPQYLAIGLVGAGVLLAVGVISYNLASEDSNRGGSQSGITTDGGPEPYSAAPPSAYAVAESDLNPVFAVHREVTYERGPEEYQGFTHFDGPEDAEAKLRAWGYQGGYSTQFRPEGLLASVVQQGAYYIDIEVHSFSTFQGAHNFYNQVVSSTMRAEGVVRLPDLEKHGNVFWATRLQFGVIDGTDIPAAFHRYTFRRGNVVAVVQTRGRADAMQDEWVAQLASAVDAKLLGTAPAATPTSISDVQTPPPVFDSGTPTPINQ